MHEPPYKKIDGFGHHTARQRVLASNSSSKNNRRDGSVARNAKNDTEYGLTEEEIKTLLAEEDRYPTSFGGKYEIAGVIVDGKLNPLGNPMIKGYTEAQKRRGRVTREEQRVALTEVQHGSNHAVTTRSDRVPDNAIYTHYHPTAGKGLGSRVGVSLSDGDIAGAIKRNHKVLRARNENYVYSLHRPKNGWGVDTQTMMREWGNTYDREVRSMLLWLNSVRHKWNLTDDEYDIRVSRIDALASHRATSELAKKYGWKYTRRKV